MPFINKKEEEEEQAVEEKEDVKRSLTAPTLISLEYDRTSHDPPFPNKTAIITAIFHSVAMTGEVRQRSYNPVACLHAQPQANDLPMVSWTGVPDEIGNLQTKTILKRVNLTIASSQYQAIGLHLFCYKDATPILSVYESLSRMAPLHFYHRAWLGNLSKPVKPNDLLLSECMHAIMSIHQIPKVDEYQDYHGLEMAVVGVSLEEEERSRKVMVVARLVDHVIVDEHDNKYVPPFLSRDVVGHSVPLNTEYCKLALIKLQDPGTSQAYFLFSDPDVFNYEPSNDNMPCLRIDVCVIDPHSTLPWWEACSYSSECLTINKVTFEALTSEWAQQGIRYSIKWEPKNVPQRSLYLLLRWKTLDMPFLKPLTKQEAEQVPTLNDIIAKIEPRLESSSPSIHELVQHHVPPTLSMNVRELNYQDMVEELQRELKKTKEENATLMHKNGFLQGQIAQLMSHLHVDHATKAELLTKPKSDLVYLILDLYQLLDLERKEKAGFRKKVQLVQNQLLQKNNAELELAAVREAHEAQQKLIASLRRKVEKYHKCYEVSIQQETIISRLEELVKEFSHQSQRATSQQKLALRPEANKSGSVAEIEEENTALKQSVLQHKGSNTGHATGAQDAQVQAILEKNQIELESLRRENQALSHSMESILSIIQHKQARPRPQHPHRPRIDSGNSTASNKTNVAMTPPSNHRQHPQKPLLIY